MEWGPRGMDANANLENGRGHEIVPIVALNSI